MSYNPVLSDQEFAQIHDGICRLRLELSQLDTSHVAPDAWNRMSQAVSDIESAIRGAHEAGQAVLSLRIDYYDMIGREAGFSTQWNIGAVSDMDANHSWPHARQVVYSLPWRDTAQVAVDIEGARWIDLYRAADRAVALIGESHYTSIEGFSASPFDSSTLYLFTGA